MQKVCEQGSSDDNDHNDKQRHTPPDDASKACRHLRQKVCEQGSSDDDDHNNVTHLQMMPARPAGTAGRCANKAAVTMTTTTTSHTSG